MPEPSLNPDLTTQTSREPGSSEIDLSVVIPVYRSSSTLPELVSRLVAQLNASGQDYEIVFVDDASPDDSWAVLQELQKAHPERIACIQLMRNFGQHNALMCGFRLARGRVVVTMDDDLQNPPEEISRLLNAMKAGRHDLVYGAYATKQHALLRNFSSWLVNCFFRITFGLSVTVTSFRAIRRELLEAILPYSLNFAYIDGLLAWNTQRIGSVPVQHCPRPVGRSGYSVAKLLKLAFNLFTNFSLLPLQIVSALGFVCAAAGISLGCWYLLLYLFNRITVAGYASTIVAVLVLGGVQLLSLGMIGEYVGRTHLNVNRMPQYTVREVRRTKQ